MRAAATAAHDVGKNISAHLCPMSILEALDAGIDEFEHGFQSIAVDVLKLRKGYDPEFQSNWTEAVPLPGEQSYPIADIDFDQDDRNCRFDVLFGPAMGELKVDSPEVQYVMNKIIQKSAIVDSTLGGLARLMANTILPPLTDNQKSFYSPQRLDQWGEELSRIYGKSGDLTWFLNKLLELDYTFWKAGGNLVLGSNAVSLAGAVPGFTNLEGLELLVDAGIPPLEVIKIETLNGARALEFFDRGTVAVGQQADLIVLDGNPATDIKAIRNVETVFKAGVGYSAAELQDSIRGTIGMIY